MKTIRFEFGGAAADFRMCEVPMPQARAGEVLVEVDAVRLADNVLGGLERQDAAIRAPGRYAAGRAFQLGAGIEDLAVGAPVFIDSGDSQQGCYSNFVALPRRSVFELPAAFDLDVAACLPDYMLAYSLFNRGLQSLTAGTVYVSARPLSSGAAMVQLGTLAGWRVIASAENASHVALLVESGAKLAFDRTSATPAAQIEAWMGGSRVNLIVDYCAGAGLEDNLKLLSDFGDLVCCGWDQGDPPEFYEMMWRNHDRCPRVRIWSLERYRHDRVGQARLLNEVIDLMQAHHIRPPILNRLAFDEVSRAHRLSASGQLIGEVVLKPNFKG